MMQVSYYDVMKTGYDLMREDIEVCGKMCSGKDTVVKRLINKGFKKVVTYTTRPKRRGETDGVDYH